MRSFSRLSFVRVTNIHVTVLRVTTRLRYRIAPIGMMLFSQPAFAAGAVQAVPDVLLKPNIINIPATGDRVPCVFVENRRVLGYDPADPIPVSYARKIGDEPTGRDPDAKLRIKGDTGHSDTVVNGIPRIGFMTGGKAARWVDEDIGDTLTDKAVKFIESHKDEPFFLCHTPHDIHEPMVPHPGFRGTSGLTVSSGTPFKHSLSARWRSGVSGSLR